MLVKGKWYEYCYISFRFHFFKTRATQTIFLSILLFFLATLFDSTFIVMMTGVLKNEHCVNLKPLTCILTFQPKYLFIRFFNRTIYNIKLIKINSTGRNLIWKTSFKTKIRVCLVFNKAHNILLIGQLLPTIYQFKIWKKIAIIFPLKSFQFITFEKFTFLNCLRWIRCWFLCIMYLICSRR